MFMECFECDSRSFGHFNSCFGDEQCFGRTHDAHAILEIDWLNNESRAEVEAEVRAAPLAVSAVPMFKCARIGVVKNNINNKK